MRRFAALHFVPAALTLALAACDIAPAHNFSVNDGSISSNEIGAGAVDSTKLLDVAVGPTQIADHAVTTSKIADGAIVASKLADRAVPGYDIAGSTTTNDVLQTATANSAPAWAALPFFGGLTALTVTSSTTSLAIGTSGTYFTVSCSSGTPTITDIASRSSGTLVTFRLDSVTKITNDPAKIILLAAPATSSVLTYSAGSLLQFIAETSGSTTVWRQVSRQGFAESFVSASASAAQALSNAAAALTLDTKAADTQSESTFTALQSGRYLVNVQLRSADAIWAAGGGDQCEVLLYKGTTLIQSAMNEMASVDTTGAATTLCSAPLNLTLHLDAADTITAKARVKRAAANTNTDNVSTSTYLHVSRLR